MLRFPVESGQIPPILRSLLALVSTIILFACPYSPSQFFFLRLVKDIIYEVLLLCIAVAISPTTEGCAKRTFFLLDPSLHINYLPVQLCGIFLCKSIPYPFTMSLLGSTFASTCPQSLSDSDTSHWCDCQGLRALDTLNEKYAIHRKFLLRAGQGV